MFKLRGSNFVGDVKYCTCFYTFVSNESDYKEEGEV